MKIDLASRLLSLYLVFDMPVQGLMPHVVAKCKTLDFNILLLSHKMLCQETKQDSRLLPKIKHNDGVRS